MAVAASGASVRALCRASVLLVLLAGEQRVAGLAARVPEINSAVLISGPGDYTFFGGNYGSRCTQMVDRAAALQQTSIMFVPSLFWVDDGFMARKSVNSQGRVTHYCYERGPLTSVPTSCNAPTEAQYTKFAQGMTECFARAVYHGLNIALAPHLDDGYGLGGWRNGLIFDPLEKYGDYSYAEFMLYPLADALNAVISSTTKVSIAMQGEMSATVFYFPQSYRALIPIMRQRVLSQKPPSWGANVEIGVSTNFDKLCGCVLQDMVDPNQYLAEFPAAFAAVASQFDTNAISALYGEVDFIGISNYASLTPNFPLKDLESATYQFAEEAKYFGVDVVGLLAAGKKLYWNEYGIGGGISQDGQTKATTAAQAAATPFFGIFGAYQRSRDPWYGNQDVRNYRNYLFAQTINYAISRGACAGCQYQVDAIYLWNDASWDIQGIYPESTTSQGTYRDPYLVDLINRYNAQVMTSGTAAGIDVGALPRSSPQDATSVPADGSGAQSSSAVIQAIQAQLHNQSASSHSGMSKGGGVPTRPNPSSASAQGSGSPVRASTAPKGAQGGVKSAAVQSSAPVPLSVQPVSLVGDVLPRTSPAAPRPVAPAASESSPTAAVTVPAAAPAVSSSTFAVQAVVVAESGPDVASPPLPPAPPYYAPPPPSAPQPVQLPPGAVPAGLAPAAAPTPADAVLALEGAASMVDVSPPPPPPPPPLAMPPPGPPPPPPGVQGLVTSQSVASVGR